MTQSKWELEKSKRQGGSTSTWEQEKKNRGYKELTPSQKNQIASQDLLGVINRTSGIETAVKQTILNRPKPVEQPTAITTTADAQKKYTAVGKVAGGGPETRIEPWKQSPLDKLKSAIDSFTGNDGIPQFKKEDTKMSDNLFVPEYDMNNKMDRIKAKYKLGQLSDINGVEWANSAGIDPTEYALKASKAIEDMAVKYPDLFEEIKYNDPNMFNNAMKFLGNVPEATAEMLPTMLNSLKAGGAVGGAGALAGGATAAIAGQLGPQVVLPEEIATVPGGALFGFSQGAKLGAATHMYMVEKGQSYKTMLDEGVDPETANKWSTAVGLANAGIEVAQLGTLMKSLGVADDALKPIASGILDKYLKNKGAKAAAQFAVGVGKETGQEVAQEAISIGGETGAKKDAGLDAKLFTAENGNRLLDTAVQSAQAFIGLQGAGQVAGSSYRAAKRSIGEKVADRNNIETVVKSIEEAPEILDRPEFASKLDDLETTVLESVKNPELEPNEVEWAKVTAERIQRVKVGRGQKLQAQKSEAVETTLPDKTEESETVQLKQNLEVPKKFQRYEEPGIITSIDDVNKPQGLYLSDESINSPHKEVLKGERTTFSLNEKANILSVETGVMSSNRGPVVGESAGLAAANKFLGVEEVQRMIKMNKNALVGELAEKYPDVDWNRMAENDQHFILEGVGAIEARKHGYDGIWAYSKDGMDKELDEFVAITKNAITSDSSESVVINNNKKTDSISKPTKKSSEKATMSQRYIDFKQNKDGKQNLYSNDFEEVKPYYVSRAKELLNDLNETIKGERIPLNEEATEWEGIPRTTSVSMARIKDSTRATYAEIRTALTGIVNGSKKANTALARRIEIAIDENLIDGYKTFSGEDIPKNNGYIQVRNRIEPNKIEIEEFQPKQYDNTGNEQIIIGLPNENISIFNSDQQNNSEVNDDERRHSETVALSKEGFIETERQFKASAIKSESGSQRRIREAYEDCGRVQVKISENEEVDGLYDAKEDTIYISINPSVSMDFVFSHELFHKLMSQKSDYVDGYVKPYMSWLSTEQKELTEQYLTQYNDEDIDIYKAYPSVLVEEMFADIFAHYLVHESEILNSESVGTATNYMDTIGFSISEMNTISSMFETLVEESNIKLKKDVDTKEYLFEVKKTTHDKTGKDIWIVRPKQKLPKEVYQNALEEIKKAKGYYSGFVKGFVFKEEPSLDFDSLFAFESQESATEKPQTTQIKPEKVETSEEEKRKVKADKLRSIADGMQKQIDDKFRDRLSNTNRRANMAAGAYAEGEALQKRQTIIRSIADDIELGNATRAVANIATRADVETAYKNTQRAISDFVNEKLKEKYGRNYSSLDKDKIEITREAANYAKMPSTDGEVLGYYLRDFSDKEGFKRDVANVLKKHRKGDEVYFHMYPEVVKLLEKAVKVKDGYMFKERLADFRRLERLGITTSEGMQQLVFDFMPYYQDKKDNTEAKKQRETKMREQEVARMKIEGFFPTPKKIVKQMIELADIQEGEKVLEPSAGAGSIADEIGAGKVDVVEWNGTLNGLLREKGHNVIGSDVFEVTGQYDKIVMNPPFEKLQDVDHVMKVYNENLKPGGRIVSIMSESPFFRSDKKAADFREWLNGVGYSEKLPDGSFKESDRQTGVNTRIVVIDKPNDTASVPDYLRGKTPDSQKLGIVPKGMRSQIPMNQKLTFDDFGADGETVEDAHKRNYIKPETVRQRIGAWTKEVMKSATRTFREIDENNPAFAEFRKEMINYKKFTHQARFKATKMMENVVLAENSELSKEEYNRFERYILLRDLMEDFKEERQLPYPYTNDNIEELFELTRNSLNDNILKSVEKRDEYLETLKRDYINAMSKVGFNVSERFTKENYFRHQVLEYYNANDKILGSSSKVKVNKNRGNLKQRHGTEKEINENYLQAEYEVMSNMIYDTMVAEMLNRIKQGYDITKELKTQAKSLNKQGLEAIIKAELESELERMGEDTSILKRYSYKELKTETGIESPTAEGYNAFNQKIAMNFSYLQKLASRDELWDGDGRWANAVEAIKTGKKDESDQTMAYIAELASADVDATLNALAILKAISQREQFINKVLGDQYYQWKNVVDTRLIPDTHSKWQPIQGKHLMMVNTVTDQLAETIIKMQLGESIESLDLKQKDLKINNMMAYAGDRLTYIIPNEASKTLDSVYSSMTDEVAPFKHIWGMFNTAFKKWVLILNPHQIVKYNLRNISGDLEAAIYTAGFKANLYAGRSAKEVFNMMKHGQFTPDLLQFFERGGLESNIVAQEIADVNKLKIFDSIQKRSRLDKVKRIPQSYTEFTENISTYRETIMRYAVYLHYKDQLKKSGGRLDFYGGSNPNVIKGLKSIEDKAFQLANDSLGAYDQVTELGQAIRKYWIPFYSFTEINFKRMFRVLKNAKRLESINEALGKSINKKLQLGLGLKAMAKLGWIFTRIMFMTVLLNLWNRMIMQDDDDKLPESVKNTPHLTLGHNEKGEVLYFSRLGTLSDLLEWFGLDTLPQDIEDLNLERKSWKQQISGMAVSPLNKLVNSISPFIKSPVELLIGRSFFPDITEPSTIRDGLGYLAQSLGVKEEYTRIAGLPVNKTYAESWINAFIYTANPKQTAYYRILDLKQNFETEKLGKFRTQTFSDSPKSKSLYNMKLSIKYGDAEKAKKYLLEYVENGGTSEGLKRSLESMSPVYGLDADEAEAFMMWITPRERQDVELAIEWYLELFN